MIYYLCLVNMAECRPIWHKPVVKDTCKLKFVNSLTRQKVPMCVCLCLSVSVFECVCV